MLTSFSDFTLPLFSYCPLHPDKHLDFGQVNQNKMALCPKSSGGFAALPREIRDMICEHIASAARIRVRLYHHYQLDLADEGFSGCIKMLHDWAPKSSVAKAAYEVILSAADYRGDWTPRLDNVIDWTKPVFMGGRGPNGIDIFSGTSIDIRDCVRDIGLDIEMHDQLRTYTDKKDEENLVGLKRKLSQLCQLPRLRRVRLTVIVPSDHEVYHKPLLILARMSSTIKQLRERVDGNLSVLTRRDLVYLRPTPHFIDPHDISWMWDPPSFTSDSESGLVAVEQRMKRLIADGVDTIGAITLVEELRAAADKLPQSKDDIVRMDDWTVGSGITKEKWLEIKQTWRRPS